MNMQRLFLFENASHQCLELCGRSRLKLGCVFLGTKVSCSTTCSSSCSSHHEEPSVTRGSPPGNVDICACPGKDYEGAYDVWAPGP